MNTGRAGNPHASRLSTEKGTACRTRCAALPEAGISLRRMERSAGSSSAPDFRPWLRCFSLIGRGSRRKSLPFDENDDSPHDKSQSREQQRVAPETEDDMKDKQENPCEERRNA